MTIPFAKAVSVQHTNGREQKNLAKLPWQLRQQFMSRGATRGSNRRSLQRQVSSRRPFYAHKANMKELGDSVETDFLCPYKQDYCQSPGDCPNERSLNPQLRKIKIP